MSTLEGLGKQQAKSLRVRKEICEATVTCLIEVGYAETSLQRVARTAGFSKGALQHHFPNKEDLMTATADRLLERPFTQPRKSDGIPETVEAAILLNWKKLANTDAYLALLEILIATRTDLKLQNRIKDKLAIWNKLLDEHALQTFRSRTGTDDDVVAILTMSRSLMRGLVIQDRYTTDPEKTENLIYRWIEFIKPELELRADRLERRGNSA